MALGLQVNKIALSGRIFQGLRTDLPGTEGRDQALFGIILHCEGMTTGS